MKNLNTVDKPKSSKLEIIIPAFRMHSQSFFNALDGISEEAALKRNDGKTNHVVWMAGNLVICRYWFADLLGIVKHIFHMERLTPDFQRKYVLHMNPRSDPFWICGIFYQILI